MFQIQYSTQVRKTSPLHTMLQIHKTCMHVKMKPKFRGTFQGRSKKQHTNAFSTQSLNRKIQRNRVKVRLYQVVQKM